MKNAIRQLPLPPEVPNTLDTALGRARVVLAVIACAFFGSLAVSRAVGLALPISKPLLIVLGIVILVLSLLMLKATVGRKRFYYVPPLGLEADRPTRRYFLMPSGDKASLTMPVGDWIGWNVDDAMHDTFHDRQRVLAVEKDMYVNVLDEEGAGLRQLLRLHARFKGEPTAEGAYQLNWLYGRVLLLKDDLDALRGEVAAIRSAFPDLPFTFEMIFPFDPEQNF